MCNTDGSDSIQTRQRAVRQSKVFTSDYMATSVSISHNAVASRSFAAQLVADLVSSDESIAAVYRRRLPVHSEHLSPAHT